MLKASSTVTAMTKRKCVVIAVDSQVSLATEKTITKMLLSAVALSC